MNGSCQYSSGCGAGLTLCNGVCVDTASDIQNCGGCGKWCGVVDDGVAECTPGGCSWCDPTAVTVALAPTVHQCADGPGVPAAGTLLAGGGDIVDIALFGSNVYFIDGAASTLSVVPKAGGAVTVLATGLLKPAHLATDGVDVYITESLGGAVVRVPVGGGLPVLFAAASSPNEIITDGKDVYWTTGGDQNVSTAPVAGAAPSVLFHAPGGVPPYALVQNATSIVFAAYGGIEDDQFVQIDKTTHAVTPFGDCYHTCNSLGVDGTTAYFNVSDLFSVPLGGFNTQTLWPWHLNDSSYDAFGPFAVDQAGTDLYFNSASGIRVMNRTCSTRWPKAVVSERAKAMAIDATDIYWTDKLTIQTLPRP
jgi:hypothetical protein